MEELTEKPRGPLARLMAFRSAFSHLMSSPDVREVGPERSAAVKDAIRWAYEVENRFLTLINWGYSDDALERELDERLPGFSTACQDNFDHLSHVLYYAVLRRTPQWPAAMSGRDVLEVGCGKGAGLNLLTRLTSVRSAEGVDLSRYHVAHATANYGRPGLRFRVGDAEALPFNAASFDLVVNVESSHNYPNLERFFAEVARVLRPGGHLVYADIFFNPARLDYVRDQLSSRVPLRCVDAQDISAGVGAAVLARLRRGSGFGRALNLLTRGIPPYRPIQRVLLGPMLKNAYGQRFARPHGLGVPYHLFVFRAAGG